MHDSVDEEAPQRSRGRTDDPRVAWLIRSFETERTFVPTHDLNSVSTV